MASGIKVAFMWVNAAPGVRQLSMKRQLMSKPKPGKPAAPGKPESGTVDPGEKPAAGLPVAETLLGIYETLAGDPIASQGGTLSREIDRMVQALTKAAGKEPIPGEAKSVAEKALGLAKKARPVPGKANELEVKFWAVLRGLYDSPLPDKAFGEIDPKVRDQMTMGGGGLRQELDRFVKKNLDGKVPPELQAVVDQVAQVFGPLSKRLGIETEPEKPGEEEGDAPEKEQKGPSTLLRKQIEEIWKRYMSLDDKAKDRFRNSLVSMKVKGSQPPIKLGMFTPAGGWKDKDSLLGVFQSLDGQWWESIAKSLYGVMGQLVGKTLEDKVKDRLGR